jgi:hypothetical protein
MNKRIRRDDPEILSGLKHRPLNLSDAVKTEFARRQAEQREDNTIVSKATEALATKRPAENESDRLPPAG